MRTSCSADDIEETVNAKRALYLFVNEEAVAAEEDGAAAEIFNSSRKRDGRASESCEFESSIPAVAE